MDVAPAEDPTPEQQEALQVAEERVRGIMQRIISRHPDGQPPEYTDEMLEHVRRQAQIARSERAANIRSARLEKWDEKVPAIWRGWSVDRLPRSFQAQANQWLAEGFDSGRNVVLTGGTGSGKTTFAYALAREVYGEGHKAKMWDVKELISALGPKAPAAAETLESVKSCALLTIDDVGSEKKSEWNSERILEIIDFRWQWKRPVILTTNLPTVSDDGDDLRAHLGDRTYSRLMDGALLLQITGDDRREND